MNKKIWQLGLGGVVFLYFITGSMNKVSAATTITSFTPGPASVGRYQKYEATFSISRTFPALPDFAYPDLYEQARQAMLPYYFYDSSDTPANDPNRKSPYGVDGISVDAHITSPSNKSITIPAFYFQDYVRTKSGSSEVMTPTNTYVWKIRFTPQETGTYSYFIRILDKNGTWDSGSYSFQAAPSGSKGFIRVSPRDNRFLEFDNGSAFIPISAGQEWWADDGRSYAYENIFTQFKQNNINFLRIWDQNDSYALTVEGHYDHYKFPEDFKPTDNYTKYNDLKYNVDNLAKGTQMNQRGNYEEDNIIESAEQNGIYIELASHGDAYWIWDASVYDPTDGTGTIPTDWRHINYWKRNFRYRVARWGYSTAILSWEHWNELGHIPIGSNWYNFYQTYAQYQRATDPYKHLLTTSQNSQAYSPGFWSSSAVDMVNYHDYLDERYNGSAFAGDEANMVYRFAQCLRNHASVDCGLGLGDGSSWSGTDKPILWTEWDYYVGSTPNAIADHNAMWAGLFSPIGMVPTDWFLEQKSYKTSKFAQLKIAGDFFSTIDYPGEKFSYAATSDVRIPAILTENVDTSNGTMRVLAMRNNAKNKAFLWAQNKNYMVKGSANPAAISGTATVGQMQNGSYNVQFWDTTTGGVTNSSINVTNNLLTVPITGLSKNVAVKAISGSISPTSTPNPPTPTVVISKPGDANGDGKVDGVDYVIWLNHYGQNGSGASIGDFNNDNKIDGVDYVIWLNNYGK